MPSMAHEILVELFRTRPSLGAEILVEVLGIALPAYTEARLVSIDLTEIAPAEYRADAVALLVDGETPVRVVIVEVQLGKDPGKRRSWPAYVCVTHAMHGCPTDLLVIAPDPDVATWCAAPIPVGPPGFVLTPPVLRREAVPVVTDPDEAAQRLELAMLSLMAHGQGEQAGEIAAAVLPTIVGLAEDRRRLYYDLLLNSINEATRKALEAKMKDYEYQSDFAKSYIALGEARGEARGEAQALLVVLQGRGIAVPEAARERIAAEKDLERLNRWLLRAATAGSIGEVLDEPS